LALLAHRSRNSLVSKTVSAACGLAGQRLTMTAGPLSRKRQYAMASQTGSNHPTVDSVRQSLIVWLLIVFSGSTFAADAPTTAPISPTDLAQMDARELGPLYRPQDAGKLLAAHELIERFFAQPESRKQTAAALEATGIDPNILGRLVRLRMNWTALPAGVYYINQRVGTTDAVYFLGVPKGYDRTTPCPLVIKLPTASAFLTQPLPSADQVTQIYTTWANDELSRHPDALVLLPLLNLTDLYGPTPDGMNHVFAPLQHAMGLVNIDPQRVYLVGHAMSAFAVWDLALHEPTYFAAFDAFAGPVTGDWQRLRMMDLRNILPVVWHDTDDDVVSVKTARSIVDALHRLKCDVVYEETQHVGHNPSDQIVQQLYETMRQRVRELYPKRVSLQSDRIEPIYNRADWVRIDQPVGPGKERRLLLRTGTGRITLYGNAFKVDATFVTPNRISVVTDNVESFRLYLNDQMIDFSQAVSVIVNGRGRFEGFLKPSTIDMLNDQLFLGRGWRYFTAVVDIDFGEPAMRGATIAPAAGR